MSYLGYVIAAYVVFVVVMLWEFVLPQLHIRRILRAARQRDQRQRARKHVPSAATLELKR